MTLNDLSDDALAAQFLGQMIARLPTDFNRTDEFRASVVLDAYAWAEAYLAVHRERQRN
jgi:hypothetical protein